MDVTMTTHLYLVLSHFKSGQDLTRVMASTSGLHEIPDRCMYHLQSTPLYLVRPEFRANTQLSFSATERISAGDSALDEEWLDSVLAGDANEPCGLDRSRLRQRLPREGSVLDGYVSRHAFGLVSPEGRGVYRDEQASDQEAHGVRAGSHPRPKGEGSLLRAEPGIPGGLRRPWVGKEWNDIRETAVLGPSTSYHLRNCNDKSKIGTRLTAAM